MRNDPKNAPPPPLPTDPGLFGRGNNPLNQSGGGSVIKELNPRPDPRLINTGGANPAMRFRPLKRGRVIRVDNGYQVNFMFNPSVLDVGFSYDASLANQAGTAQGTNAPTATYAGEGQIHLDLLFDRTYELWDGPLNSLAGTFGVHADVLAFYAFLDMIPADFTTQSSWESLYPSSQIGQKNAYLYIGNNLKYYGYISALSVQYVHWSFDMIPTRAAVGVDFNVILTRPTTPGASGAPATTTPSASTPTPQVPQFIPGKGFGLPR